MCSRFGLKARHTKSAPQWRVMEFLGVLQKLTPMAITSKTIGESVDTLVLVNIKC